MKSNISKESVSNRKISCESKKSSKTCNFNIFNQIKMFKRMVKQVKR